jgi:hypothetical protein
VARGELLGPAVPGANSAVSTYVWVPETYLDPFTMSRCYMFQEATSAACAPPPVQSARTVRTTTHVGRYPPVYYLAVGWPSLLTSSVAGIYLMQMASVVIGTAFLALAVATARRWSSSALMVPAIAVAATPMTLFMSSSVNPSGLEMDAAIAMWAAAVVLVADHLKDPPRGLVGVLAISVAATVWTRPTALAWPLVAIAVLGPSAWRKVGPRVLMELLGRRDVLVAGCALAVAGAGALLWALLARATAVLTNFSVLPASSSYRHIVSFVVGRMPSLLEQGVGNFGWLDTPVPWFTLAAWSVLCAWMLGVTGLLGTRKVLFSALAAVAASFAVPVITLVAVAKSYGYVGQGRYFVAIWVSLPIVVGLVRTENCSRAVHRLTAITGLLVGSAQAAAYYWALRRYIVGIPGSLSWAFGKTPKTAPLQWHPPVPGWWLVIMFAALCAAYGVSIARSAGYATGGPGVARSPRATFDQATPGSR